MVGGFSFSHILHSAALLARFVGPICPLCRWGGECFILKQLPEARGRQWYGETIIRVLSGRLNIAFIYRISIVYLSYIYRKNTVVVGVCLVLK